MKNVLYLKQIWLQYQYFCLTKLATLSDDLFVWCNKHNHSNFSVADPKFPRWGVANVRGKGGVPTYYLAKFLLKTA